MSCNRNYGISNELICSGNGKCVNGDCICNDGWTSRADGQLSNSYDCDINILYMKSIGGINFILSTIAVFLLLRTLSKHPPNFKRIQEPRTISQVAFVLCFSGTGMYSFCKLYDPVSFILFDKSIYTFPVGLGLALFSVFLSVGIIGFVSRLINFLQGYSKMMSTEAAIRIDHSIYLINFIYPILFIISIFMVVLMISCYILKQQQSMFFIGIAGGISLMTSLFTLSMVYFVQTSLREMRQYLNTTTTTINKHEIQVAYNTLNRTGMALYAVLFSLPIPMIIFTSWSYLIRKFDYLLSLLLTYNLILTLVSMRGSKQKNQKRKQTVDGPEVVSSRTRTAINNNIHMNIQQLRLFQLSKSEKKNSSKVNPIDDISNDDSIISLTLSTHRTNTDVMTSSKKFSIKSTEENLMSIKFNNDISPTNTPYTNRFVETFVGNGIVNGISNEETSNFKNRFNPDNIFSIVEEDLV